MQNVVGDRNESEHGDNVDDDNSKSLVDDSNTNKIN